MSTRAHHRLTRSGHRAATLGAQQAVRYRATLVAVADLDTSEHLRPEHARTPRAARRTVRRMLRTGALIGDPS